MKNFIKIKILFFGVILCAGQLRGMTFLPEAPIERSVMHGLTDRDGLRVDMGVEYAATVKPSALGSFLGPFGQHSFEINQKGQNGLLSDNYILREKLGVAHFAAVTTAPLVTASMSLRAERYALEPLFIYQAKTWFLGIKTPWRVVEHKTKASFTAGDSNPESSHLAVTLKNYFSGDFEETEADYLQAALVNGKLVEGSERFVGLSDVFFILGKQEPDQKNDVFNWHFFGAFVRLPVRDDDSQETLFRPRLGLGGKAEIGLIGQLNLPLMRLGETKYNQLLRGSLSLHAPYTKTLLPDLRKKGWGNSVLVGIEGMPYTSPAQPLANLLTQQQAICSRVESRVGYEGLLNYQGLLVNFSYSVRFEEEESLSSHAAPLFQDRHLGLIDTDFYPGGGGGGPTFGDDPVDFESDRAIDWLGSTHFFYKPLRPALFGQEIGLSFSKKIGAFEWKSAILYFNYPKTPAFDSFSLVFNISHNF